MASNPHNSFLRLDIACTLSAGSSIEDLFGRFRQAYKGNDHGQAHHRYGATMSKLSRRKLITTGLAAAAGASGLAAADSLARRYGLIPPDAGGLYGPAKP